MERIRQFFRGLKKQLIVGFSHDYIYTNGVHGETRGLPNECPYCHADQSGICGRTPERWYGSCMLLGFIDTNIRCERSRCGSCHGVWEYKYYYPDEAPYGATSS